MSSESHPAQAEDPVAGVDGGAEPVPGSSSAHDGTAPAPAEPHPQPEAAGQQGQQEQQEQQRPDGSGAADTAEEETFPCVTCGFICDSVWSLQLHNAYHHYFSLIFVCKFCSKEFDEKNQVAEHILKKHVILNEENGSVIIVTDAEDPSETKEKESSFDDDYDPFGDEDEFDDDFLDDDEDVIPSHPLAHQLLEQEDPFDEDIPHRKRGRKSKSRKKGGRRPRPKQQPMPGMNVIENPDIVNQSSTQLDYTLRDRDEVQKEVEDILKTATGEKDCPLCHRSFFNRQVRDRHVAAVHIRARMYKCEKCFKTFKAASERNVHFRRIHLQIRDKKCRFCGKAFSTTGTRNVHEKRIHHGVPPPARPPKKCEQCDKIFANKDTYTRHYKVIHLGLKPYKCPVCQESFKSSGELSIHKKQAHLLTLFDSKKGFKRGESRYKSRANLVPSEKTAPLPPEVVPAPGASLVSSAPPETSTLVAPPASAAQGGPVHHHQIAAATVTPMAVVDASTNQLITATAVQMHQQPQQH